VGKDLVDQSMLEARWRVMVDLHIHWRLLSIRVRDRQPNLLRDLAGVGTPSPKVVRPRPLAPPGMLLHVVDGAGATQDQCSHILTPGVWGDSLNAEVDAELQLCFLCLPPFIPGSEVENPAAILNALLTSSALPETLFREDYQELLRVVLHNLEISKPQTKLGSERVVDMERLCVVAVALEPTDCSPTDEHIPAPLDSPRGGDEHPLSIRTCSWIAGVGRHCSLVAARHLQVGTARVSPW